MKKIDDNRAKIISKYIIKQIKKISKINTCNNNYLRVTKNINNSKCIYIKFNKINGVKDVQINFIDYCNLQRKIENGWCFPPKKSILDYWKIYKERLPRRLYKYLDLLSKRYDCCEPENVRKLAIMVLDNISKSGGYRLFDGSYVYDTIINTEINCYKITLKLF